ncbi:MAG: hypothetical protein U1F81_17860 [Verrucomicrobiaceae bacterium]
MKLPSCLLAVLSMLLSTTASAQSYTDIDVSNQATIAGAIDLGTVQLGQTAGSVSYGVRMNVSQQAEEVMQSYTIPGFYQDNWVTIEDYGTIWVPGYYVPNYTWGIVGQDYFPAVYDENGNELTGEHWEPRYGDVYTGDSWVQGYSSWGITGTHQENQPTWVSDDLVSYTETRYDAPLIHSSATRGDANWVWEVPDSSGGVRKILRLWDGGLALPLPNGDVKMTLSPTSLFYTSSQSAPNGTDQLDKVNQMNAEGMTQIATVAAAGEQSKMEARPELLRLTRTEVTNGSTTIGQTQIAAKSAAFGGVVEVAGDLKVQGTLRVPQRGDVSMGEFTSGPQP